MAGLKAAVFGLSADPDFIYDTELELSGPAGCFLINNTFASLIDFQKSYTAELEEGVELIIKFTGVVPASATDQLAAHFEIQ